MATIKRFEDLRSWQEARKLVNLIYKISGQGPFKNDLDLRSQIRRAAISVVSNIAEGFEGDRNDAKHRGSVGGWKLRGLPWVQE